MEALRSAQLSSGDTLILPELDTLCRITIVTAGTAALSVVATGNSFRAKGAGNVTVAAASLTVNLDNTKAVGVTFDIQATTLTIGGTAAKVLVQFS